jgi:2-polyprenyl-3-methyl-5-hydroxy-6-metoxy-1,4-benzoquinol methylase
MNSHSEASARYFQQLYQRDVDPWKVRQRWYEQRKRDIVLACLPDPRYRRAFEPACGNGQLTAALAQRAEHLTASDMSPEAVRLTRLHLQREHPGDASRVTLACQTMPQEWPADASFDLIVISEMLYYLRESDLSLLLRRCIGSLAPGGALLLCHWRRPFADRLIDTDTAHQLFDESPALHHLARHAEDDFLLDVWSSDAASVAQREGLA